MASRPKHDLRGTARFTIGSVIVHAGVVVALFWATMSVGQELGEDEKLTIIEIPAEETAPPPPPPPPKLNIETPVPAIDVAKGFQTLELPTVVPPNIPPPNYGAIYRAEDFTGKGVEGGRGDGNKDSEVTVTDLASAVGAFTPMTVRPELVNRDEVGRALVRDYPPLLRDASIGGTAKFWFLIDETGKVIKTELKTSSGYDALDEAAARVAAIMRFTPAKNRDKYVPVWIEIPILFQSR